LGGGQPEWPAQTSTHSSFSKSAPNLDKKQQQQQNQQQVASLTPPPGLGNLGGSGGGVGGGGGGGGGVGGTSAAPLLYTGIPYLLTRPNNNIGNCKAITTTTITTTTTNNNNNSISANNNNQLNNNSTTSNSNNNNNNNPTSHTNTIVVLQNGRSNSNSSTSQTPAKMYHRARSQEFGLDHPHTYQPAPLYVVTDDSSETDTVASPTGCFPFLKSGNNSSASNQASGAVHLHRFGGSLGNSPAVGRKKHSLDSSGQHPPPISSNSLALPPTQLALPSEDNNTYDHAFYRDVIKKMSMASIERVNSKSSGDLTMYNSSTRLTTPRDCDDAEEAFEGGRFQRNFSGSQFPRHCFFTRQEGEVDVEVEEAELDSLEADGEDDSHAPINQMRQNSTTSRKSSVT